MQMSRHDKPVRCLLFYFAVHVVDWRLSIRNCFQLPACKNTLTAHLKGALGDHLLIQLNVESVLKQWFVVGLKES